MEIVIRMYYDDHLPPPFHALYAGYEAVIGIEALALIEANCRLERWGC
jgi:hypothetical protein